MKDRGRPCIPLAPYPLPRSQVFVHLLPESSSKCSGQSSPSFPAQSASLRCAPSLPFLPAAQRQWDGVEAPSQGTGVFPLLNSLTPRRCAPLVGRPEAALTRSCPHLTTALLCWTSDCWPLQPAVSWLPAGLVALDMTGTPGCQAYSGPWRAHGSVPGPPKWTQCTFCPKGRADSNLTPKALHEAAWPSWQSWSCPDLAISPKSLSQDTLAD